MMLSPVALIEDTADGGAIVAAETIGGRPYAFTADAELAGVVALVLDTEGCMVLDIEARLIHGPYDLGDNCECMECVEGPRP